jgi:hypothetical protein
MRDARCPIGVSGLPKRLRFNWQRLRGKPPRNAHRESRLATRSGASLRLLRAQFFDDALQRFDHFVLVDA